MEKLRVVRDIERMDNSKIAKFWFYKLKILLKFVNFEFWEIKKFLIWEIPKICNEKFQNFHLENSKNFLNLIISENSKFENLENYQNPINFQFYEYNSSYILSARIILNKY